MPTISKVNSAITATSLTAAQVAKAPGVGIFGVEFSRATISDNTAYALMALYKIDPLKFFAGLRAHQYANPTTPLSAGFNDIGGYVLAFVSNNAYNNSKTVQGVLDRRPLQRPFPSFDLTAAYYGYRQNAYGTGKQAGCTTAAYSTLQRQLRGLFLSTPTTDSTCTSTLTWAPCTAGCTTAWPSGYLSNDEHQPTVGVRYRFLGATRKTKLMVLSLKAISFGAA